MAVSRRQWLIPAVVVSVVVIAVLAFGVFGVQTLFYDDEVSEAAPVFTSTDGSEDTTGEDDPGDGSAADEGSAEDNGDGSGDAALEDFLGSNLDSLRKCLYGQTQGATCAAP